MKREQSFPLTNDKLAAEVAALRAAPMRGNLSMLAGKVERVRAWCAHIQMTAARSATAERAGYMAKVLREVENELSALSSPVDETPAPKEPSPFFVYNLPLQVWPAEDGEDARILNYMPRRESVTSMSLDDARGEQPREDFLNESAHWLENLAALMRKAASDPSRHVYYHDADPAEPPATEGQ